METVKATLSGVTLNITNVLSCGVGRMCIVNHVAAAIALCWALSLVSPPSVLADTGERDTNEVGAQTKSDRDDGVDWQTVRTTVPEKWSEDLKAQLVAAGYDVDRIADRVRKGQADAVWSEAIATPQEE